jgi:hypothetical protein
LEVRIQLGIKFTVVAEEHANSLVSINTGNLQISAECVLDKVSVVGGHLEAIRASDFHQGLISSFTCDGMSDFLPQLEEVAWGMEIRVKEGFASGETRDVSYEPG